MDKTEMGKRGMGKVGEKGGIGKGEGEGVEEGPGMR